MLRMAIIVIVATIGFSMTSCSSLVDFLLDDEGSGTLRELGTDNSGPLGGAWATGDIVITFSGSNGVFARINGGNWKVLMDSGHVKIGDAKFRNITESKDNEWTAQELYTDLTWGNKILILSSDGKTLGIYTPGFPAPSTTYTKQ